MTEYKCKRGHKIAIPEDKCDNEAFVYIPEPKIRAFCAFCTHKEIALTYRRKSGVVLIDTCCSLRSDLSWDDWRDDTFDDKEDEE